MKTNLFAACFALTVAAQLWVVGAMIFSSERTIANGTTFNFQTAPVDPNDVFRGKYVALQFKASNIDSQSCPACFKDTSVILSYDKNAYALIESDGNGFARVAGLQVRKPASGYYMQVKATRRYGHAARIEFPFAKFFLEEGKAEKAERLFQKLNNSEAQDSYAVVRVNMHGQAVIENLVLGGIPVLEAVK